jgi:hypothetical protein
MYRSESSLSTVLGLLVAAVAVVGTQFSGWEWGSGQLPPTVVGTVAAVVAVAFIVRNVFR